MFMKYYSISYFIHLTRHLCISRWIGNYQERVTLVSCLVSRKYGTRHWFVYKSKNIQRMFYVSRNEATHIYGRRVKREQQK